MATITPIDPGWLARTFVEYEMLPDLLSLPDTLDADTPPDSWHKYLSGTQYNTEHLNEEDLPAEEDIPAYLAADAWALVRQLQLVAEDGLTPAGQRIAAIADTPQALRSEGAHLSDPCAVLAEQVKTCYRGQNNLEITALLQRGAGVLAETKHVWAAYCPGLLLVEFESLIQLAGSKPDEADKRCEEMVLNRDYAMHPYDQPSPDRPPVHNMVDHADAVTLFYFDNSELMFDPELHVGTSRATAMLYTFTGLLREVYPVGPVHCLAPPGR